MHKFIPSYPTWDNPNFDSIYDMYEFKELLDRPNDQNDSLSYYNTTRTYPFFNNAQTFIGRWLAPYTNNKIILSRWDTGTGKTRVGISCSISNMMFDSKRKTLFLSSGDTAHHTYSDEIKEYFKFKDPNVNKSNVIPSSRTGKGAGKAKRQGKQISKTKYMKKYGFEKDSIKKFMNRIISYNYQSNKKNVSWDTMLRNKDSWLPYVRTKYKDYVIIIDEVHTFRNSNVQKQDYEYLIEFLDAVRDITTIILMTATPIVDKWRDLISIIGFLVNKDDRQKLNEQLEIYTDTSYDYPSIETLKHIKQIITPYIKHKISDRVASGIVPRTISNPFVLHNVTIESKPYTIYTSNNKKEYINTNFYIVEMSEYQSKQTLDLIQNKATDSIDDIFNKVNLVKNDSKSQTIFTSDDAVYSTIRRIHEFAKPMVIESNVSESLTVNQDIEMYNVYGYMLLISIIKPELEVYFEQLYMNDNYIYVYDIVTTTITSGIKYISLTDKLFEFLYNKDIFVSNDVEEIHIQNINSIESFNVKIEDYLNIIHYDDIIPDELILIITKLLSPLCSYLNINVNISHTDISKSNIVTYIDPNQFVNFNERSNTFEVNNSIAVRSLMIDNVYREENIFKLYYTSKGEIDTNIGLGKYSIKYAKAIHILNTQLTDKMGYIHTLWVEWGTKLLCASLLANGWEQYNGKEDPKTLIQKPRFAVIHSFKASSLKTSISNILELAQSPNNRKGELLQIIVGSRKSGVSLSFTNCAFFFEMSADFNKSSGIQSRGRVLRANSLHWLKDSERSVYTYDMISIPKFDSPELLHDLQNHIIRNKTYNGVNPFTTEIAMYLISERKNSVASYLSNIFVKNSIETKFKQSNSTNYDNYNILYSKPQVSLKEKEIVNSIVNTHEYVYDVYNIIDMYAISNIVSSSRIIYDKYGYSGIANVFDNKVFQFKGDDISSILYKTCIFEHPSYSKEIDVLYTNSVKFANTIASDNNIYNMIINYCKLPYNIKKCIFELAINPIKYNNIEYEINVTFKQILSTILQPFFSSKAVSNGKVYYHYLFYAAGEKSINKRLAILNYKKGNIHTMSIKNNSIYSNTWRAIENPVYDRILYDMLYQLIESISRQISATYVKKYKSTMIELVDENVNILYPHISLYDGVFRFRDEITDIADSRILSKINIADLDEMTKDNERGIKMAYCLLYNKGSALYKSYRSNIIDSIKNGTITENIFNSIPITEIIFK